MKLSLSSSLMEVKVKEKESGEEVVIKGSQLKN